MAGNADDFIKRIIQEHTAEQGLNFSQKTQIPILARRVLAQFPDGIDRRVVFVTLLNCLASLIATQFPKREHPERVQLVQSHIGPYVAVYDQKERKL